MDPSGCMAGYNDGVETDANETQIAMCTLRSFPFLREPRLRVQGFGFIGLRV